METKIEVKEMPDMKAVYCRIWSIQRDCKSV